MALFCCGDAEWVINAKESWGADVSGLPEWANEEEHYDREDIRRTDAGLLISVSHLLASLGFADEAWADLLWRSSMQSPGTRFPAFWPRNFDWMPDQDHGGVNMITLQKMVLQPVGKRLLLFPAWPRDQDIEFKLHAPLNTTVECVYRKGKIEKLIVTPASRAADIENRVEKR